MKRLLKVPARMMWRMTRPLRVPIMRKFDAMIMRIFAQNRNLMHVCHVTEETSLLMDHMVRELVRLQTKVESLQATVEDLSSAGTTLSIVPVDTDRARSAG
jgi:hypothetical protein